MRRWFRPIVAVALFLVTSAHALAGTVYMYAESEGRIYALDTDTGAVTGVLDVGVTNMDIAVSSSGEIFAIDRHDRDYLKRIDPESGEVTDVGPLGTPADSAQSLAFSPSGVLHLYAWSEPTGLYTVDTGTGEATFVGEIGFGTNGDIEFTPDGRLFLTDNYFGSAGSDLVEIDPGTGEGHLVGTVGVPDIYGLAYVGGVMYGIVGFSQDHSLWSIDLSSGDGTRIASLGPRFVGACSLPAPDQAPIADAGPDQPHVECGSAGSGVDLDGSGSSDPDGDQLTYTWTGDFTGGTASGVAPHVVFPGGTGSHVVTLVVDDGRGETDSDMVTIEIVDTTPPSVTAPPAVTVFVEAPEGTAVSLGSPGVSDVCDPSPTVTNDAPALFPPGTTVVTWTATDHSGNAATATQSVTVVQGLTALAPAKVWIGLKNSDDVGTNFDLLAEVLRNGTVVGSGQVEGVSGGSSGFNNAVQRTITLALGSPVAMGSGDVLGFRLSVRVAATGHRSGTARLWYNDAAADSRFGGTVGGAAHAYYLVKPSSATTLSPDAAGSGVKKSVDVFLDRAANNNPWKSFGTWTYAIP